MFLNTGKSLQIELIKEWIGHKPGFKTYFPVDKANDLVNREIAKFVNLSPNSDKSIITEEKESVNNDSKEISEDFKKDNKEEKSIEKSPKDKMVKSSPKNKMIKVSTNKKSGKKTK